MMDALILLAVGLAGYTGGSNWWPLAGAVVLTVAGWWRKVWLLRSHPVVPLSSKMTTYFVVSVAINLAFAWTSFLAGIFLRWLLAD
jgi:hypothetical protein